MHARKTTGRPIQGHDPMTNGESDQIQAWSATPALALAFHRTTTRTRTRSFFDVRRRRAHEHGYVPANVPKGQTSVSSWQWSLLVSMCISSRRSCARFAAISLVEEIAFLTDKTALAAEINAAAIQAHGLRGNLPCKNSFPKTKKLSRTSCPAGNGRCPVVHFDLICQGKLPHASNKSCLREFK